MDASLRGVDVFQEPPAGALLLRDRLRDRWDALVAPLELFASSTGGRVKLADGG